MLKPDSPIGFQHDAFFHRIAGSFAASFFFLLWQGHTGRRSTVNAVPPGRRPSRER